MDDTDNPNRASKMEKAEGDSWSSDPSTVERRDRERPESGADADDAAAGISNRPVVEDRASQTAVPPRGEDKRGKTP